MTITIQEQAVNTLADTLLNVMKDMNIPYDVSAIYTVSEKLSGGKYKVARNGKSYICKPLDAKSFEVNDKVLVLLPCGSYEDMIIMGKAGG